MASKPKYIKDEVTFNREFERLKKLKTEAERRVKVLEQAEDYYKKGEIELSKLQQLVSEASDVNQELDNYRQVFEEIKIKLDNPETGLEAIHNSAIKSETEIDEHRVAIEDVHAELDRIFKRTEELNKDVEQTLGAATNGGLANSFGNRAKEIRISKRVWQFFMFFSAFALIGSFWPYLANPERDVAINAALFFRIGLVTPFIFLMYFSAKQYGKERDLEEKYEFKSVIAQSMQSYTKLFRDEFGDKHEETVLKFLVDSIDTVYKEPYIKEDGHEKSLKVSSPIIKTNVEVSGEDNENK